MYEKAIEAIDAQNLGDPETIFYKGKDHPKEQLHAQLMTQWVKKLDPEADEAQLLAARANHLRRWELPRADYPSGRVGYLRWRKEQARRHAELVSQILKEAGYDQKTIGRVGDIIQKKKLLTDPQVQTHEDALCLVFLETQFETLRSRLIDEHGTDEGEKKLADIIQKTLKKMSPTAKQVAMKMQSKAL